MKIKKAHCFFEQSGTFKNAFKHYGIDAEALINGVFRDVNIVCENCWLYTGINDTYKQAVEKWNEMTERRNK